MRFPSFKRRLAGLNSVLAFTVPMFAFGLAVATPQRAYAQVAPGFDFNTIINFGTADATGRGPVAGVISGNDGNLYGTTATGGVISNGAGTLYRYNPSTSTYTQLVNFGTSGFNGNSPNAGVTLGANGNLYGTTVGGGSGFGGTVYRYNLISGVYTTLVNFSTSGVSGSAPFADVTLGSDGNLYGTTTSSSGNNNGGTLFRYNLTTSTYTLLFNFTSSGGSGYFPFARVTYGADGNLYGTTQRGGSNGGTLYRYNLTNGAFTTLFNFSTFGVDGGAPYAGVTLGADGNLYGTTSSGGSSSSGGTLYRYNPTTSILTTVVDFGTVGVSGFGSHADLTLGNDGNFYGTTQFGANGTGGTVYRYNPVTNIYTTLVDFSIPGISGTNVQSRVFFDNNGSLYATTTSGGSTNNGTLFRLTPATSGAPEPHTLALLAPIVLLGLPFALRVRRNKYPTHRK